MLSLHIVSPLGPLFEGEVESITLPGTVGSFTVLQNHAPIISSLEQGWLVFHGPEGERKIEVRAGFVEVSDNVVKICME